MFRWPQASPGGRHRLRPFLALYSAECQGPADSRCFGFCLTNGRERLSVEPNGRAGCYRVATCSPRDLGHVAARLRHRRQRQRPCTRRLAWAPPSLTPQAPRFGRGSAPWHLPGLPPSAFGRRRGLDDAPIVCADHCRRRRSGWRRAGLVRVRQYLRTSLRHEIAPPMSTTAITIKGATECRRRGRVRQAL